MKFLGITLILLLLPFTQAQSRIILPRCRICKDKYDSSYIESKYSYLKLCSCY